MHDPLDVSRTPRLAAGAKRQDRSSDAADRLGAAPVASHFGALLRQEGPHAALGYLNARTRFRFTGMYHTDGETLRNVEIFDRENPAVRCSGEIVPLRDTYCGIACRTVGPFVTRNAQRDHRLTTHAARNTVLSYCGVPIRLPSGAVWGTLCHVDQRPRLAPPDEPSMLEASARELARWLCASQRFA